MRSIVEIGLSQIAVVWIFKIRELHGLVLGPYISLS